MTLTADDVYEMRQRARKYQLRHDDAFYGPLKDARCGCKECQLAADVVTLADVVLADVGRQPDSASTSSGHEPTAQAALTAEAGLTAKQQPPGSSPVASPRPRLTHREPGSLSRNRKAKP